MESSRLLLFVEPGNATIAAPVSSIVTEMEVATGKICGGEDCPDFPDAAYDGQPAGLREVSCMAIQSAAGCEGCGFDRSNEAIGGALRNPVIDEDLREAVGEL